jgi:hypothetical protein
MEQNLTNSTIVRQNILNNKYAVQEIQTAVGLQGILFEQEFRFTKKQIADFFEITERTIDNYLEKHAKELEKNGYEVLRGKRLIDYKLVYSNTVGNETDFVTKSTVLGIFNFRAFINIAMLLTTSDKAKELRSVILDIVIDTINKRTGGNTKFINQRDEDFVVNLLRGEDYRREFTDALRDYVDLGPFKYIVYTDKIYKSIFKENATEYRKVLKLEAKENVRHTMYSEILDIISSFEIGFAENLENKYKELGRKLNSHETDLLYGEFENRKLWEPLREKARVKMASRDMCFRDAMHENLKEYISSVTGEDFQKFLGEKSMELDERLDQYKEALKRLKERE